MTQQDYSNDPTLPFEDKHDTLERPHVEHITRLSEDGRFFGVMTPRGISLSLIALSFIFGGLGIVTFIVLFWVLAWILLIAGVLGYLLVIFGVWSVTNGQELVVVHHAVRR